MMALEMRSGGTALTPYCCRIYAELADQYKVLDPASAVAKRHVLAEHLREVIDLLELKVGCVGVGVASRHDTDSVPASSGRRDVGTSGHLASDRRPLPHFVFSCPRFTTGRVR
jgi:hypothetical protein